ncbi:Sulfate-transporting ATPase protein [Dioscorea alata]|uniref:Sulfate-transporting ATPase protein n=2 Tax=Dioscorea alata TaxID=55571 RepID=A0ACB7TU95_DIOAL|nr:Sulfate-transporting ATPase protein [Dioscorea alata]
MDARSDCSEASFRDDEALKWAALEKLPTYDRVRRGILTGKEGETIEVDIRSLGLNDRRSLIERLVRVAEEDNEKFLLKLKNRMERVGIEPPTIEVRVENLNVTAEAYVGSRGVPTVLNFFGNKIEEVLHNLYIIPSRKKPISVLQDISGVVKPCRMTLLLGPPGSGKTTLLLAMAGKLDSSLKVCGRVSYNGHEMNEFVPQRTSAYISQYDVHLGQMTVRETLAFSARCQGIGTRYEMLMELVKREKAANITPDQDIDLFMKASSLKGQEDVVTDYILKILGLEICADTMVGDAMVRGISGGQRKRVTTGEMLVGPAKALFMDEISTGLDSSTTFQIINSIRQSVHILGGTAVISLLQPAPETYELFDDIILLSDGRIVYQGPRENVIEFFESMGFRCPERKGIADFLQEVTSKKDQRQYWSRSDETYQFISVKEFADSFQSFHVGHRLQEELSAPFDRSKNHPAALTTTRYGISMRELLKACISRELLLTKRNAFVYIFKLFQLGLLAFITMTAFLRTNMHHDSVEDGLIYMGALFISITTHMFNGFAELAMSVAKLPVFYKQRDLLFFPAWAYAIPAWIVKLPISFLECGIWVAITYYVIGFDPSVQRLFRQFLIFSLISQMASGLFRLVGAIGRDKVVANTLASFAMLILIVLGGFILSRNNIKKWWIWGYWSSPVMYAQNSVAVNEFLGKSWRHVVDATKSNKFLGVQILESRGIFPQAKWFWIGMAGLVGYVLVFNALYTLALTYLDLEANEKKKGMVLPFAPLSLTFNDIVYSVDMPSEMKAQGITEDRLVLLKGVSGAFRPGVLTALMGVSGAGKTTLMDVLAGRKTGGYIDGNITISGYPKKQETFARISGYCEQNDIHSPYVTVYESVVYSAWLRLPPEVDPKTRETFVEEVMELVELTTLRKALVGLPGVNGLSTEQRKRLTIAVELVANPSIIFMDEPTSGLDARAAAIVMRTVRNTVDTGRTVVCTIHQPSIDIFEAFDELFLMKRGGEEIYVGPLGHHSHELIKYFEGINGVSKIKDSYNPATWMLEVTTTGQEIALGVNFAEVYKNSDLFRRNKALISELSIPTPGSKDLHFPTQYSQPFPSQCMACFWKQYKSYWRNPAYNANKIIFTTVMALLLGAIFWRLGSKRSTKQDLFNAMGALYAAILLIGIQNSLSVQPVVDVERTVFYREKAAGMYSALPYAFAQVAIEVPYTLIQTLICGILTYSMIDFDWTLAKFLWYIYFTFCTLLYFTYYGMMSVSLTPNSDIAAVVCSAFVSIWNIFAGFVLPRPRIPIWWRWYFWVCPISWSLYGFIASQFGDMDDPIDGGEETVKGFIRRYFGYKHDFLGVVAAVEIGIPAFFGFIFAFAIKKLNFQNR